MDGGTERFAVFFRAARVLRRIGYWLALSLSAAILGVFAINSFDERPSAEAVRLLRSPENHYKPDENIYLALVGFDAPSGQSVVDLGETRIEHYNSTVDSMLRDPLSGLEAPTTDPAGLKFTGSLECCRPRDPSFWGAVHTNGSKFKQLVEQNRELYERYLALFERSGYYETARPSPVMPMILVPTEVRTLFLASVSWELQTGDEGHMQAALERLRQDTKLWQRVLNGQGGLLSKMIAIAFLQTDSIILSDMIADPNVTLPPNTREYLPDFALDQWNISNAFAAEFRFHAFLYQQMQAISISHWQPPESKDSAVQRVWYRISSSIERQFFKLNATQNLDARYMDEFAGFAAVDSATFANDHARLKKWEQNNSDLLSVRTLYNPIGRILVLVAAPAYEGYVLRPYDTAAIQRLVRLGFEIRREAIAPSAVAAFMKLHPEWSTHPADGRPFVWDPSRDEITIQPVAQHPPTAQRRAIRIWKASEGK